MGRRPLGDEERHHGPGATAPVISLGRAAFLLPPVLDLQPRDAPKLSLVVRHEDELLGQGMRGDHHVVGPDGLSAGLESGAEASMDAGGGSSG